MFRCDWISLCTVQCSEPRSIYHLNQQEEVLRYTKDGQILYDPPQDAPLKGTLVLRAEIRADFSMNKNARKNLPTLPGLNFEKLNFSAPGVGADQVCKNMRVYKGNSVKTNVLSANSEFVPELALIRFNQERG